MGLFERYVAGECEQSVTDEALEVAREMMQRVKYNFNVIADNLIQLGFEFEEPEKVLVSCCAFKLYIRTGRDAIGVKLRKMELCQVGAVKWAKLTVRV